MWFNLVRFYLIIFLKCVRGIDIWFRFHDFQLDFTTEPTMLSILYFVSLLRLYSIKRYPWQNKKQKTKTKKNKKQKKTKKNTKKVYKLKSWLRILDFSYNFYFFLFLQYGSNGWTRLRCICTPQCWRKRFSFRTRNG